MLSSIFQANADHSDLLFVIAGIIFVVAAVLVSPTGSPRPGIRAYATTLAYLAAGILSFGFLFLTP